MLKLGSQNISALYVGGTKIKRALVGETVVFEGVQTVGVPTQRGTLTYSGSFQSPTWSGYDSGAMTIGGTTSATNAGTYTATFTLKSGYVWPDGTTGKKNVTWTIGKANASFSVSPGSSNLNPYSIKRGETETFSITCSGCTVASAVSSNTARLTVDSFSSEEIVVTVNPAAAANTNLSVVITLNANENYKVSMAAQLNATIYLGLAEKVAYIMNSAVLSAKIGCFCSSRFKNCRFPKIRKDPK